MPALPKKITVDMASGKLLVEGVEFPWYISADGVTANDLGDPDSIPSVTFTVLAGAVEVIPKDA